MVEGIGRMEPKTHGFYHLKLCMTDKWNHSVQFIHPFLAVDRSPQDSQVLLGRPALKDLKISINNSSDSWEVRNLPCVKKVSSMQFDRDILSGAQVFEVRVVYRPVSKDPKDREDLPSPALQCRDIRGDNSPREQENDFGEPLKCKRNKNKSSREQRRKENNPRGSRGLPE